MACNHNQYKVENCDKIATNPLVAQAVLLRYGDYKQIIMFRQHKQGIDMDLVTSSKEMRRSSENCRPRNS